MSEEARKAAEKAVAGALIAAFMAGWGNSSEGYNAEYGALQDDVADTARHETEGYRSIIANAAIDAYEAALSRTHVRVPREATEAITRGAREFYDRTMGEWEWAALALFLDKLAKTHVIMTREEFADALFERGQLRYSDGYEDGRAAGFIEGFNADPPR